MLPLLPRDKANHAVYGSAIFAVGALAAIPVGLSPVLVGVILVTVLAVGKEAYDKVTGKGVLDYYDAVATIAGALPVAAVTLGLGL